ncbi:MAG: hypothetical protein KDD35_11915, partial [Bdellovibrionales bacterium]|nr:hypothetical protein [Bdellovibrionales bacterium]
DKEVFRIVTEGYQLAKQKLEENMDVLHRMAEALLEHETIDSEEVTILVKGGGLPEINERRGDRQQKLDKERQLAAEEEAKKLAEEEEKKVQNKENEDRDPVGNTGPVTA